MSDYYHDLAAEQHRIETIPPGFTRHSGPGNPHPSGAIVETVRRFGPKHYGVAKPVPAELIDWDKSHYPSGRGAPVASRALFTPPSKDKPA